MQKQNCPYVNVEKEGPEQGGGKEHETEDSDKRRTKSLLTTEEKKDVIGDWGKCCSTGTRVPSLKPRENLKMPKAGSGGERGLLPPPIF